MRKIVMFTLVVLVGISACSRREAPLLPNEKGTITLKFSRLPSSGEGELRSANAHKISCGLAAIDSAVVRVYHPGSTGSLDAVKGVPVSNQSDSIVVSIAATPGIGKKVTVELFEQQRMIYFGVDENVNVFLGQETHASIDAFWFGLVGFGTDATYLLEGEVFNLFWRRVPAATAYYLQESTTEDFSNVVYDVALTDTMITLTRNGGPHYFRVAPINPHTTGTFSPTLLVYVYGSPTITSVFPGSAARGEAILIRGTSLDYPGNYIEIGDVACVVLVDGPEEVVAVVPPTAYTGDLIVYGPLNPSGYVAPARFVVQLIAYITGLDLTTALDYQSMIQASGSRVRESGVKIVPYTSLETSDMSSFVLAIVGTDTGDDASWAGGVPERLDALRYSGAQIIGLGLGGNSYFREAGLFIGQTERKDDIDRWVFVNDWSDPIYNSIMQTPGNLLELYTFDVFRLSVYMDLATWPAGVIPHAKSSAGSNYHPLISENEGDLANPLENFLWGFAANPKNLTGDGRTCFMNVVELLFNASSKVVVPPGLTETGSLTSIRR